MVWSSICQLYHSLPCYTWFEPIFTPLWSSFLCWQSLKKSYQQTHHNFCSKIWLEVLFDNHIIHCMLHVVWVYFNTIMILLSCLNNFNQQTHLNFCSKRWLEVQFDNYIIHSHVTRGLSPFLLHFDHSFFAGKVWRNPTNKLVIIFVLRFAWSSFWQSYHSLPSYTWVESILTPLWSSSHHLEQPE